MARLKDDKDGKIAKAEVPDEGQRFIFHDHRNAPFGLGSPGQVAKLSFKNM